MAETVFETLHALQKLASFELDVHPQRCVRIRNRHASCSRCADACTSGALFLRDGDLDVDDSLCVGCGTCATVCPTGALEAQHPSDAVILNAARPMIDACDGMVVFACERAFERDRASLSPDRQVVLTCLSRVEETLIVRLFGDGAMSVVMVHGDCDNCPRKQGLQSARLVCRTVGVLVDAWNLDRSCALQEQFPEGWIDQLAGAGADVNASAAACLADAPATVNAAVHRSPDVPECMRLPMVEDDGTLPHFVPTRRNQLLDALSAFGDPVAERLDTRLWGHIVIDFSACESCRMCAVFCPTGAICKFEDEEGRKGIEHYVAECVHCRLCEDICPAHAITSESSVPAVQLAHGETERYPMPEPKWHTGPDQILRRMRPQISGNDVRHSCGQ